MRTFVNLAAGAVFIFGLPAVLFIDSAVRYGRDPDALVDSARSARLRESLVDATAALVVGEVSREPNLAAADRVFIRGAIDHVLSADWFEGTLRSAHGAMLAGAAAASRTAVIDLDPFKESLQARLGLLEQRTDETCRALFGADPCRDQGQAQVLLEAYQERARRAVARIPYRLILWPDAAGAENLDFLATVRWTGFGMLLASAIALILANWRRPGTLGAIVLCGALLFVGLVIGLRMAASGPIAELLLERAHVLRGADEPVQMAAQGLRSLVADVVADATRRDMLGAFGLAAAGLTLVAVGRARRGVG